MLINISAEPIEDSTFEKKFETLSSEVTSKSYFRTVFYASFGKKDTWGLEESILPSDSKKYRLSDFLK